MNSEYKKPPVYMKLETMRKKQKYATIEPNMAEMVPMLCSLDIIKTLMLLTSTTSPNIMAPVDQNVREYLI